jgi:hypothetical protein
LKKTKPDTPGVQKWSGGHEANTQDIGTSADGRCFNKARTTVEFAKPSLVEDPSNFPDVTMGEMGGFEEPDVVNVCEPKSAKRYVVSVSIDICYAIHI